MAAERQPPLEEPTLLYVVDVLEPALARLSDLSKLAPDWDSYGADPISPAAVRTSRGILLLAAPFVGINPKTQIRVRPVPIADGGVQLEWQAGLGELEIEVDARGQVRFMVVTAGRTVAERDEASISDVLRQIEALIESAPTSS